LNCLTLKIVKRKLFSPKNFNKVEQERDDENENLDKAYIDIIIEESKDKPIVFIFSGAIGSTNLQTCGINRYMSTSGKE
jgi:disulfide oxidoreductase YuzD